MRIVLVALVALLAAPGVAAAKGPLAARVAGPGLEAPIVLEGERAWDSDSPLAMLATDTGLFPGNRRALRQRPRGELGPRYDVELVFPNHATGKPGSVVEQRLYPYATAGPTVHTARGQRLFDDATRTVGGWYRVPRALADRLGLPLAKARSVPARATVATRDRSGGGPSPLWAIGGVAVLALVVATRARLA